MKRKRDSDDIKVAWKQKRKRDEVSSDLNVAQKKTHQSLSIEDY